MNLLLIILFLIFIAIVFYKVKKSKFYESKYGYLIEEAIPVVFEQLSRYFAEHNADFKSLVLGKMHTISDYPRLPKSSKDDGKSYYHRLLETTYSPPAL